LGSTAMLALAPNSDKAWRRDIGVIF